jgi:hypothetical protein
MMQVTQCCRCGAVFGAIPKQERPVCISCMEQEDVAAVDLHALAMMIEAEAEEMRLARAEELAPVTVRGTA